VIGETDRGREREREREGISKLTLSSRSNDPGSEVDSLSDVGSRDVGDVDSSSSLSSRGLVEGELSVVLGSRVLGGSKGKEKEETKEVSSCELAGLEAKEKCEKSYGSIAMIPSMIYAVLLVDLKITEPVFNDKEMLDAWKVELSPSPTSSNPSCFDLRSTTPTSQPELTDLRNASSSFPSSCYVF